MFLGALPRTVARKKPREEGIAVARESLLEVRDIIQGVQVSAPFGNGRANGVLSYLTKPRIWVDHSTSRNLQILVPGLIC